MGTVLCIPLSYKLIIIVTTVSLYFFYGNLLFQKMHAVAGIRSPGPLVIWNGKIAILVVENEMYHLPHARKKYQWPFFAAYYCSNIPYPRGSSQFYSLLEILLGT